MCVLCDCAHQCLSLCGKVASVRSGTPWHDCKKGVQACIDHRSSSMQRASTQRMHLQI